MVEMGYAGLQGGSVRANAFQIERASVTVFPALAGIQQALPVEEIVSGRDSLDSGFRRSDGCGN